MKWLIAITSIVISGLVTAPMQARIHQPLVVVSKPTVIAFFPTTQAQVDRDADTSEAIDDFNFYVFQVKERFAKAGITIQIVNAPSFRVQADGETLDFPNSKKQVGYYFIAPGKKPRIEYGVMTDQDLLEIGWKYFGIAIP